MCFSASASFGAGIILTVAGTVAIRKAKKPSQLPFASIPLIFAVQQVSEGFLWLALTNPDYVFLKEYATYTFIAFAQIIWPIWVPFSILMFDPKSKRKLIGKIVLGIGVMVGVSLGLMLITNSVSAEINGCHISYIQEYLSDFLIYGGILYIIAIIAPPFISVSKKMWTLGIAISLSYIITEIFYAEYIVSVWCFFAAIISVLVYWIVVKNLKNESNTLKQI